MNPLYCDDNQPPHVLARRHGGRAETNDDARIVRTGTPRFSIHLVAGKPVDDDHELRLAALMRVATLLQMLDAQDESQDTQLDDSTNSSPEESHETFQDQDHSHLLRAAARIQAFWAEEERAALASKSTELCRFRS